MEFNVKIKEAAYSFIQMSYLMISKTNCIHNLFTTPGGFAKEE